MTPVIRNPDFVPGLFDANFHQFIEMNKIIMQDFRDSRRWKSIADIQSMLSPPFPIWQATQLRNYLTSLPFDCLDLLLLRNYAQWGKCLDKAFLGQLQN